MTEEETKYRREILYDEVWRDPVRSVARRYGISDVALAKICRKLQVPLPWSGYWAQVRAGQQVKRPPLPTVPVGAPHEIVRRKLNRLAVQRVPKTPSSTGPTITVPSELRNPHALVSEAARLLRGQKPHDGLVHCCGTRCLDISVGPASLRRALRIMNALIRALEDRDLRVEVTPLLRYEEQSRTGTPSNASRVQLADEWIQFGLTEKRTVVHEPGPEPPRRLKGPELESWLWANRAERRLVPNGSLELSITNARYLRVRTVWQDGKRQRLEHCLDEFVAHLYVAAQAVKQHREDLERAQRARQEEERRHFEREHQRRVEEERTREFEEELLRWRLARDAREYMAEVRSLLGKTNGELSGETWQGPSLAWIEEFARRVDPLTQLRKRSMLVADSRVQPGEQASEADATVE